MEDSEENEEAKRLARNLIEQANRGEMVEISGWLYSSTVIAAALQIFVRACQDGTCRAVEELYIDVQDEIVAPSLRNLFQNCPNLREVRGLPFTNGGYRVLMEAINEGMCPNVKILKLCGHKMNNLHVAPLVRAIENGKLKSVETLDLKNYGPVEKRDVNAIVSAFSTGHCFNLEELVITNHENCDASVAEKFVGAIADQRFPRLRAVPGRLFDPEEMSDKSKWEAAKNILARNLAEYWIEESSREKKELRIDGRENHPSVIASALEIFWRACQDGKCTSLESLVVFDLEDESVAASLWNIFQNCPNLPEVDLESAKVACRVLLEAVNEGKCPELENLGFGQLDESDVAELTRAIENGNLKNLRTLKVGIWSDDVPQSISDAIILALTNGECPNLESVRIVPVGNKCNASNAKKFVRAIADEKFLKLHEVDDRLMELRNYLSVLQVPEEFANKGNETILSYLREGWEHGTELLSVVKVVITGPGSVGKTCLVSRLVKDEFPKDATTTIGVDVTRKVQDDGLELVYYDFGGQPVYATTHQLFLGTRAVFLIAWQVPSEMTNFENQPCHQHAQDLFDVSPEAQIIFVTTKSDRCSPLSQEEQTKLEEMYEGHFQGYFHVSAKTEADEGTENLKNSICALADTVLHSIGGKHGLAGVKIPKPYVELKRLVASLRDEGTKFHLTTDDWKELAEQVGIVEQERVESVLSLFHEMGEVLQLPTGQIIIDPPKLSDVLARVVTHDERYKQNARGGYLRHNELDAIWEEYDKELHVGFLRLLHECEVGYPIRDNDGQDYGATLIPAMLYTEGETMQAHVQNLRSTYNELKAGPQIVVKLSTRSDKFGPKLLPKLRSFTVLGGWWQNGCIVVDKDPDQKIIRSFGTVSWTLNDEGAVVTIATYGQVYLLRSRILRALQTCLVENFPRVRVDLDLKCMARPHCPGGWTTGVIMNASRPTLPCSGCNTAIEVNDIAFWIASQKKAHHNTDDLQEQETTGTEISYHHAEAGKLEDLQRMLRKESGMRADVLSYQLLAHQKDLLGLGCGNHGRDRLNAIWLIFEVGRSLCAYPLCPHLIPESILVHDGLEVSDVPDKCDLNLSCLKPYQEVSKTMELMLMNSLLNVPEPREGAEFKGILWNNVRHANQLTRRNFQQVQVPEIGSIWVYNEHAHFFRDQSLTKLVEDLTAEVRSSSKHRTEEQSEMKRLRREAHPDLPTDIVRPCKLKSSGQAIVYRGTMAGKDVAVKVFKKESDWETCRDEVSLLLQSGHDNVMRVLAFFEAEVAPKPCFVMRFIPGGSLRDRLNKPDGKFIYDKAIALLKGIGEGLCHLHSLKIVHRDLKPENILLEERDDGTLCPVLIDLGLGKKMEGNTSQFETSEVKGTFRYIAPEMFREGHKWGEKTDMYALGIIMWEVLSAKKPYANKGFVVDAQIQYFVMNNGRPANIAELTDAGLSQVHVNLIQRLWDQDPKVRPTAEEFVTRIDSSEENNSV